MEGTLRSAARDLDDAGRVLEQQLGSSYGSAEVNPVALLARLQRLQARVPALESRAAALQEAKPRVQAGLARATAEHAAAVVALREAMELAVPGDLLARLQANRDHLAEATGVSDIPRIEGRVLGDDVGGDTDESLIRETESDVSASGPDMLEADDGVLALGSQAASPPPVPALAAAKTRSPSQVGAASTKKKSRRRRSTESSSRNAATPGRIAVRPMIPLTEVSFAKIPSLTRGRCKYEDVVAAYAAINTVFNKGGRRRKSGGAMRPLTVPQLDAMGVKCSGRTGSCVLNSLRHLGLVEITKEGVKLPGM